MKVDYTYQELKFWLITMWNLFKRPIKKDTLDAWVKILEDCAKVAIVAIPVVMFGDSESHYLIKLFRTLGLVVIAYLLLAGGRKLRESPEIFTQSHNTEDPQ
ncbi:hypothetical protein [Muribacter muris]|nr:hypothetical protein [Muribacter muris]